MSRQKKALYVGGLDNSVTEEVLYAAFIPFGDIKEVNIPKDFAEGTNRGFGFVDFEEEEDAAAALDNMDGAELFGKVSYQFFTFASLLIINFVLIVFNIFII